MYRISARPKTTFAIITAVCLLITAACGAFAFQKQAVAADAPTVEPALNYKYIAHKGKTNKNQVGNQLSTFKEAAKNPNVYGIETDIWRTADGRFVCIHGSGGKKANWGGYDVKTTDFATLRKVHPDGQTLCTLKEFLNACKSGNKLAVIDITDLRFTSKPKFMKQLVDVCYNNDMLANCRFTGGQPDAVKTAYEYAVDKYNIKPEAIIGTKATEASAAEAITFAKKYNLTGVNVNKAQLDFTMKNKGNLQVCAHVYKNKEEAIADQEKYNLFSLGGEFSA